MTNWIHALRLLKAERDWAERNADTYRARHGEAAIAALEVEIAALESKFLQTYPLYEAS